MMQKHKKLSARILSMALSAAMVATMLPTTVLAAEGDLPLGASSVGGSDIGTIQSFDKLEDRFIPSVGKDAPSHVYGLSVALNTPATDLTLPTELTAMVARTTTAPAENEDVVDSGKPSEPAVDETIPDEDNVAEGDTDDTVSDNQPASPSDAEEEVKEEIKDGDVPLAPEPEQDEEAVTTTVKSETIPVTWNSDKEYKSDANGAFIYTAEISEDYILVEGVELPQIYVYVGKQAKAAKAGNITTAEDLSNAFQSAANGDVITLGANIDMGSTPLTLMVYSDSISITLDLNNYNITCAANGQATIIVYSDGADASLTITGNGKIEHTVAGPVLSTQGTDGSATITVNGGTISGGNITLSNGSGKIVVNGGTIIGGTYGAYTGASPLQITGGTVKGKILNDVWTEVAPKDGSNADLYLTTITLGGVSNETTVSAIAGATGYATTGMKTDTSGKLYLWLPVSTIVTSVTAGGTTYSGTVTVAANNNNAATFTSGPSITIDINNGTIAGGATLQAVVEANGGASAVTELTITAGEVTTEDWNYLKSLSALTTFEIADTIADDKVANIPHEAVMNASIFPKTIVSVTVPQAITIGDSAFKSCPALTTAIFPAATSIANNAFISCPALTTASFPAVTSIGNSAFSSCTALTSASFPAAISISTSAFSNCTALVTLKLPATPPSVGSFAFYNCPDTRALGYVDTDGNALTGEPLKAVKNTYKISTADGDGTDGKWYGWTIDKSEITISGVAAPTTTPKYTGTAVANSIFGTPTYTPSWSGTPTYTYYSIAQTGASTETKLDSAPKDVGSYKVVISIPDSDATYMGSKSINFAIEKATIKISANNKTAYIGDTAPTLGASDYTITGLASGESLTTSPTIAYAAMPDMSKAGTVDINVSGAAIPEAPADKNYNSTITYEKGTLTISNKSSGGGSSSSSSQTILTSVPPAYTGGTKIIGNIRVPDYTVEGAWSKNENGTWIFAGNGGQTYVNTWAPIYNPYADVTKGQSAFDWFMFDANGNMMTGWYTDANGSTYYLNPNSDNTLGAMKTGWVIIDGKHYYFNEMPDGSRGKLFKNTKTPDGYLVDENGVWNGNNAL